MKIKKSILLAFVVSILTLSSSTLYAHDEGDKKTQKTVEMLRNTLSKPNKQTWQMYSKAAQLCINRGINLEEAKEWIDKAVTLNPNEYTLEIMGDFYYRSEMVEEAWKYYREALLAGMNNKDRELIHRLQYKILRVNDYLKQ
ncbi:hypothetical protein [Algivirga pacifica]|uniref:Tetratricopeptide repeat-containing protein n=1 Tax=Algivirga pacifica TaxID=1162670 RepID=A0ABP9DEL4_9BACT